MSPRNDTRGQAAVDPWIPPVLVVTLITAFVAYNVLTAEYAQELSAWVIGIVTIVAAGIAIAAYWLFMTAMMQLHQRVSG